MFHLQNFHVSNSNVSRPSIILLSLAMAFGVFCSNSVVEPSFERDPPSAEAKSLAGAWVAGKGGFLANRYNPAIGVDQPQFGASYSQPFGIDEVYEGALEYANKLHSGSLATNWQSFGSSKYKEDTVSVSYARSTSKSLDLGASLKLYKAASEGFNQILSLDVDIGTLWEVSRQISVGVSVSDLLNGVDSDRPARALKFGVRFHPPTSIAMNLALQKRQSETLKLMSGVEFQANSGLIFRFGAQSSPWQAAVGWSVGYKSVFIDYAWLTHSTLNGTHLLSLKVQLKRN